MATLLLPVPLYHAGGTVAAAWSAWCRVRQWSIRAELDTLATLHALQDEHCTAVGAVPTMFIAILNQPEFARFDLPAFARA